MSDTFLKVPTPNIPMIDAMGQTWSLKTVDDGDGNQAIATAGISGGTIAAPESHSGTLTAGGTAQTVYTTVAGDSIVLIQNPPDLASQGIAAAENLFVRVDGAAVVNGSVNYAVLAPGQSCAIGLSGSLLAAGIAISVNATTINHIFYCSVLRGS